MEKISENIKKFLNPGSGDGYGSGYGDLKSFNGHPVHYIDDVPTVILNARLNVAKGYIVNGDLTTSPCYVVKDNEGRFAHGETLEEARQSLEAKIMEGMDEEERIEKFVERFDRSKTYKGTEFYEWHHTLTGSCTFGRDAFVKDHGLDLEKEYTVAYFLEITANSFGGDTIRKLQERYSDERTT